MLLGDFRGLFLDIVFNDILTMQRSLDISRFLYSGVGRYGIISIHLSLFTELFPWVHLFPAFDYFGGLVIVKKPKTNKCQIFYAFVLLLISIAIILPK